MMKKMISMFASNIETTPSRSFKVNVKPITTPPPHTGKVYKIEVTEGTQEELKNFESKLSKEGFFVKSYGEAQNQFFLATRRRGSMDIIKEAAETVTFKKNA